MQLSLKSIKKQIEGYSPEVSPSCFEKAEEKILQRLFAIYSSMRGPNPQTFAQVSMGQLRSIQVNLVGDVASPGTYTLPATATVFNALYLSGEPSEIGLFRNIKIIRENEVFRTVDIYKFLIDADPSDNVLLKDQDIIFVPPLEKRVEITGEFKRNGLFELKDGESLDRLIRFAGGFTEDAYWMKLQIRRKTQCYNEDLTISILAFDVGEVLNNEKKIILQPEDIIVIKSHFSLIEPPCITVRGEVQNPGQFAYADSTTLGDAIFLANVFTEEADCSYIEVARRLNYEEASDLSDQLVHIYTFNLARDLQLKPEDAGFILETFDYISVKKAPGFNIQRTAEVYGQVKYAGVYTIRNKKQRISDLINLAGGITPEAYINGATLTRVTGTLGYENVAIDLDRIMKDPDNSLDLLLRDGDSLYIPELIETVKVSGMVPNPFFITYQKGKNLRYYIDKTGGFETEALRRKLYVQYPNGETASTKNFIIDFYLKVQPGSQIVVPEKPPRENKLSAQEAISISSALTSMALIIVTIINTISNSSP